MFKGNAYIIRLKVLFYAENYAINRIFSLIHKKQQSILVLIDEKALTFNRHSNNLSVYEER